jgi:hypothetical protein
MASIVELTTSPTEPVDLTTAQTFLRVLPGTDDDLIQNVIVPGARRQLETALGLMLANRDFVQYEDGFPFFPYFQSPYAPLFGAAFPFYFGYGPIASYPYPAIGGLQNQLISPFEKRLLRSPVTAVRGMSYVGTDGKSHGLLAGKDFSVDFASLPGRLTPLPGQRWPVGVLGNSTVAIYYTAGYLPPGSANEDAVVGAVWQALIDSPQNSYVFDPNSNVELQTAAKAVNGILEPVWPAVGATAIDGKGTRKNLGPVASSPWAPGTGYVAPLVIRDRNGNLQSLAVSAMTSGATEPTWKTQRGQLADDGSTTGAWMSIGADQSQGATDPPNQITEYPGNISIPPNLYMALLELIVHWYQQRSVVVTGAGAGGAHIPLPLQLEEIIGSERVLDFSRGR